MRVYDYTPKKSASKKIWRSVKRLLRRTHWGVVATWGFRLLAAIVVLTAILFVYYGRSLPDPNKLLARSIPESTKIYDRNGGLLYEAHGEYKRTLVNLDQISPFVQEATIAVEDKNFYNHGGISVTGTLRSVFVDVLTGQKRQGGSTITQQFVKNAMLSRDKSFLRKIKEIILSVEIETRFSKKDILKLYLNEIPYGRNAYGIEAAAQTYFNKHAVDLTLAESAYLAALPQSPTYYSPSGPHADALQARQRFVLGQMKDQNYITAQQYQEAVDEKVVFNLVKDSITAPHFVLYVEDYLAGKYGDLTLEQGGLKVYTTLDPDLQKIAEDSVKTGVDKFSKKYNANNAALVAVDPKTGQILAMVGSKDYFGDPSPPGCTPGKNCLFEPNVNVATSQRQPGSSFKPYAYLTAFGKDAKYSPASLLVDVTTNFGTYNGRAYIPHNYDGQSHGPVSMRQALAGSLNVPAVKTLSLVGVDNVTQTAHNLGITSPLQNCGLSLVLGGCEVRLIDHVAAYAVIANEGSKHDKTAILKVVDQNGQTLEEYQDKSQQVADPQAAYELISIMTDNAARSFIFGASSPLAFSDRPVACKTGTTQGWRDGWTICFTPSLAVGVWSGNNDGTLLKPGADGVLVAAPIVHDVVTKYLTNKPVEDFTVPDGITKVTVDSVSGKLPNQYTTDTKTEVFADYSVPTDYDNVHLPVKIDGTTGQPATDQTLPANIQTKVFTILHSERPDNPNWENPVIAWALEHGYSYPTGAAPPPGPVATDQPLVAISSPQDGTVISETTFNVSITASSTIGIARVDLAIDGTTVGTASSAPYLFTINSFYPEGQHIITAHAVDAQGNSSDTSAAIIISLSGQPLTISDPVEGENLVLPGTVTAIAGTQYQNVTFYYQNGGTTKAIGQISVAEALGSNYYYSIVWSDSKLKAGSYKLYVRSNTGTVSKKITVTVGR